RQPTYAGLLSRIRSRFPGSENPLPGIPAELQTEYRDAPLKLYARASDDERTMLERLLMIEAALQMAQADLKADGSNGTLVAAELERLVPERPELPQEYREAEFKHFADRITQMDRAAILEFRNKLRAAEQEERATQVVRQWIDHQLSRRANTPETTVDRAEFEFEMLGDAERALQLASSAMSIDPDVRGGKELLDLMGYGWHGGKAVKKSLIPAAPRDPIEMAVEEGRLLTGMSEAQVRAANGAPQTVVRLATQGEVTEIWHYPAQRLTLHLAASRLRPQLQVTKIVESSK
ncbi:MAG: hypothetical protein KDA75_18150, partial [Planctomycetaceae bacterium]|nr:hypothetical protein [Planctomycetaceae bacterium]